MSLEVSALRALAHPLRLRMLSLLTGAPMSAAELARELDITHANASYHLRALVSAGLVVDAGEEKVRGGVAKRYRYDAAQAPPSHQQEPSAGGGEGPVRLFAETLASELIRRSAYRLPGPKGTTTDAELWLQPDDWRGVVETVAGAMQRLHDVAQPPRTEGCIRVSATVSLFEMERER